MTLINVLILISSLSFLGYGITYFTSPQMKNEFKRFRLEKVGALTAVLELLGAVGLLFGQPRRVAGVGLFVLTNAVTPAHIYMLQVPELFPSIPVWTHWLRLPIQVALLALIACGTLAAGQRARRSRPPPGAV